MEKRAYALLVGLFTLLLGAAAGLSLWWFAGAGGGLTSEYVIESPRSVTGLSRQAAVRFRGIRVGKVTSIDLDASDSKLILVTIEVNRETPITMRTRARIGFQGISGMGHIQLDDDGHDPAPLLSKNGTPARIALNSGLMDQVTEGAPEILARLRSVSENMSRLMSPDNVARIEESLRHMAKSAEHIEKTLEHAPALMEDARRFSSPENAEQLREALKNIQAATAKVSPALESFNQAMNRVSAAGSRIDRVGGTLEQGLSGETLPRVNLVLEELQVTANRMSRLLEELERNPQVLISGREPAILGPGEQRGAQ